MRYFNIFAVTISVGVLRLRVIYERRRYFAYQLDIYDMCQRRIIQILADSAHECRENLQLNRI